MNNRIPHYLIESFITAAEEPSLQQAAEKLQITQSTLSKQMIMFEELLPHKVFAFDGRKKVLTSYGSSLYEALKPKFAQTQELIEQTSLLFSQPENVHVRICGRGEFLDILAVNLKFNGRITFLPMNNESALEAVLQRKAELAIVHTGIDSTEIVMKPFILNEFRIAVSKGLLKTKPKAEDLTEKLKGLPCLLYKMHDPVIENLLKSWKMTFEELNVHRTYPNYTTLARMVSEGQGWALLPSHTAIDETLNHVIPVTMSSSFNRKFHLCYRKDISSASWLKELLSEIKQLS
ncbi:LysR family transcriptional regulator [Peredibacter starrii]|uniref:LysR family transcriptional regulator n=1 Tax=Peredibacter starrii TaxID=28202 RepID=A0AAX4HLP1_9BACT|nr:LysR family transcriptional regulator [Peredibacter starrii]WPU64082.1 LysR family transcriptional regulator [Peredibacter starrii]